MPSYRDLILAKPLKVERFRFDVDGTPVGDSTTMPDNGYEAEHTPLQKFVHDYLSGQAYAVETVYAVLQGAHEEHLDAPTSRGSRRAHHFVTLARTLATEFVHRNVQGMVGFAMKQTFDYVRRGERLNSARAVMVAIEALLDETHHEGWITRLDTPLGAGTIFDELVKLTGLEVGSTENNNKLMRTLKLNGREYLETTTLLHFKGAVEKLIGQYGDRSTKASETDVDWKSLSHATRVYQQVIELLETGFITFPRSNAVNLLAIKQGERSLDSVKELLRDLDDQVQEALLTTTLPEVDEVFRARVDDMLFTWIEDLYLLEK